MILRKQHEKKTLFQRTTDRIFGDFIPRKKKTIRISIDRLGEGIFPGDLFPRIKFRSLIRIERFYGIFLVINIKISKKRDKCTLYLCHIFAGGPTTTKAWMTNALYMLMKNASFSSLEASSTLTRCNSPVLVTYVLNFSSSPIDL